MSRFFLQIYDYLHGRRRLCLSALALVSGLLLYLVTSLSYNEDIFSFLPMSDRDREAISIYQELSGGQRVVVMFRRPDSIAGGEASTDLLYGAVDDFVSRVEADSDRLHLIEVVSRFDLDFLLDVTDLLYDHLPVMLTEADYRRIDSLLSHPGYVPAQLARDREMLTSALSSGVDELFVARDPLQCFSPVMERLEALQRTLPFAIHDGHLHTADDRYALVLLTSPYGPLESALNDRLVADIEALATEVHAGYPEVEVGVTGAPVISVGNARQIKRDSTLSISLSLVLILTLLLLALRRVGSLMLIGLSILFGWLLALGGMAVVRGEVSLIVLGIGSIIIGIAVNYPLHFIAHVAHGGEVRSRFREMVAPLLIGNVTTVGAFITLVPMDAPALSDLGLFAAFLLLGTILFVLLFLPHLVGRGSGERLLFGRLLTINPRLSRGGLCALALATLVLGYHSLQASFDSDINSVNFLSDEQEQLLTDLGVPAGLKDTTHLYVIAQGDTWDDALDALLQVRPQLQQRQQQGEIGPYTDVLDFLCSEREQRRRIARWEEFWRLRRTRVDSLLSLHTVAAGFSVEAFAPFAQLLDAPYEAQPLAAFDLLRRQLFSRHFSQGAGRPAVIGIVEEERAASPSLKARLNASLGDEAFVFDLGSISEAVGRSLSVDFNYIGWCCGAIVFLFLWFSFGRFELSVMAFLPMVLGWIWILGLMHLLDIRFNIINVILATFIFGQGDDYTIFITEGLMAEHAYRRRVLPSFRNSILLSALIMFIGMGSLIVARHPALHSLAEVTIVGMFCVVFMAWMVPGVVFSWLVGHRAAPRPLPITLPWLCRRALSRVLPAGWGVADPYARPFRLGAESAYYRLFLLGQYLYKGQHLERETRALLRRYDRLSSLADGYTPPASHSGVVHLLHAGHGQFALLFAWTHPALQVRAYCDDPEDVALLSSCSLCPAHLQVAHISAYAGPQEHEDVVEVTEG